MNIQKVTADYRMSQWTKVIQARQESGQNINEFCQTEGISRNAYFYWQRKLRGLACVELSKTQEAEIVPRRWVQFAAEPLQQAAGALDLEVNGCRITVTSGTNHDLLAKVCRTLRSL